MGHDLALEDDHQQDDPVIEEETLESAESTKSLVVKVNKVWMVYPQQPTKEEVIYMSNIDRMVQYPVELFFIYPPNPCKSSEGIFEWQSCWSPITSWLVGSSSTKRMGDDLTLHAIEKEQPLLLLPLNPQFMTWETFSTT
jgi:hypothetical protein